LAGREHLSTVREVAQVFRVCAATVYKWAASGELAHVRIVNVIRVRREDVADLLKRKSSLVPVLS
jgi:excisionase family DNA binding protein